VHLAVATADVVHLPAVLGPQLVAVLAGTSYQHAAIHLYADHPDIDDAT
jgi:hypothetical protein